MAECLKGDGELLTVRQVLRRLGMDPDSKGAKRKIYGWIEARELEAVNVAGARSRRPRWKFSERAFETFVATRSSM